MSKQCQVTGKIPMSGNNVSKAVNKTRRRFMPNLHKHRFWVESENRYVTLNISTKGLRIIDKKGIKETRPLQRRKNKIKCLAFILPQNLHDVVRF